MTRDQPPERDRLTALETGTAHLRELMDIRHQQNSERFSELAERNRVQDLELARLVKQLGDQIDGIKDQLWRGLKWLGGLLCATVLSVVLKALGLI